MSNPYPRPTIVLSRGPRSGQRALFDAIEHSLDVLGPGVLARPIHLLVPSHSLRSHLLESLLRDRGRSLAGLSCWTLRGLAREIVERAGESPATGAPLLPILVRRAAQAERSLHECLDHLRDGYGSLVGTVTDLLEAGLEPPHGEAIEDSLASEGRGVATAAEIRRAQSLVRVANRVQEELAELGLGTVSSLLKQATEILGIHPDPLLPCSGLHVYGFADATGVATDLILASLKRFGGTVYLDRPPDPLRWQAEEPAVEFGRRFNERLLDLGRIETGMTAPAEPPRLSMISALGTQAEVREIGWRIRLLLDAGVRAETVAVVGRRLEPYRSAIRTHFGRLGIPFSAMATPGPQLPRGRHVQALLDLLANRGQSRLDRWLDARDPESTTSHLFDLRLALFGFGVSRLQELAELRLDQVIHGENHPLPVRLGFEADETVETGASLQRRTVPTSDLRRSREEATQICSLFDRWSSVRLWSEHIDLFSRLLSLLDWRPQRELFREVQTALSHLARGVDPSLQIDLDEWTLMVRDALGPLGLERFGGLGGGVQILDVTEARARTFGHLFLLGMNKGVFPRTIREDPAFPDSLRQVLGREGHGVLPDLPRKRSGYGEERFLFSQLYASSPHLTVSWQMATDDNKEANPSPLVERLLLSSQPSRARNPQSIDPVTEPDPLPRTELESGIRAAIWGSRRSLQANLVAAVPRDQSTQAKALASARLRIVDEMNLPPGGPSSHLGPYLGFIGAATDTVDPRVAQDLYVTTLENLAACPWQTFLQRVLRLESPPDPIDVLPGLEPLMIGQLVHRVLETIGGRSLAHHPASLEEARLSEPIMPQWPDPQELAALVKHQAAIVAAEQGLSWDGYPAVLAQVVMPYLEQARSLSWSFQTGDGPVAVEMDCDLELQHATGRNKLRFRADRVDAIGGRLVISDYKTGRQGVSDSKTQKTRDRHLLAAVSAGRLLQAMAYARAAGGQDDTGRYLFVRPDFSGSEDTRIVSVVAADCTLQQAFESATSTLLTAWHPGLFFPRLVEPDTDVEPRRCQYCDVAEACLRGDSSARGRLRDWTRLGRATNKIERSLLDTWNLASTRKAKA